MIKTRPFLGISARAENNEAHLAFTRHHTGGRIDWEDQAPRLRPVWPLVAGGLGLMAVGAAFTLASGNAGAALGGLVISLGGIALLARAAWLLGSRPSHD